MAASADLLNTFRVIDTVEYICGVRSSAGSRSGVGEGSSTAALGSGASSGSNRGHRVVCLQFPDELLSKAPAVAAAVQAGCRERGHDAEIFVLADTTYNSLSVDEVAAAHVGADCVVHYGRASLTKLSRLPAFFVFPEAPLDAGAAAAALAGSAKLQAAAAEGRPALVFLDQPLLGSSGALAAALRAAAPGVQWVLAEVPTRALEPVQVSVTAGGDACRDAGSGCGAAACCQQQSGQSELEQQQAQQCCGGDACGQRRPPPQQPGQQQQHLDLGGSSSSIAGFTWSLPLPAASPRDAALAWVGAPDAPALLQLQLTYSGQPWAAFDPAGGSLTEGLPLEVSRALRRRYFLLQKARDASIVGILVGTLGVAGYREAIDALRAAAAAAGKKAYTLLVGKPSPAKLANFPEIEVFVMVADPQGQILDCKDYLAPIVTPHEAMLAFDTEAEEPAWDEAAYRLDFDDLVQAFRQQRQQQRAGGGSRRPGGNCAARFSLVDGALHGGGAESADEAEDGQEEDAAGAGGAAAAAAAAAAGDWDGAVAAVSALALQAQAALSITPAPAGRSDLVVPASAADYLVHKRSWRGVEAPLVGAARKEAAKAVPGLSGRAAGFAGEGRPGSGGGSGES